MMYWYRTAIALDSLYLYEREKVKVYGEITGIQSSSLSTLRNIYDNKKAIQADIEMERKQNLDRLKKDIKILKVKNVVLTTSVVGLVFTTFYFAAL
jgi:hypothetical protein